MSTHSPTSNPADPGPFQKYLFSGACYVQIGQCYALVKQAAEQGSMVVDDEQLRLQLLRIWQDYVTQQLGALGSIPVDDANANEDVQPWYWSKNLYGEIQRSGAEALQCVLAELEKIESDKLDLQQFFLTWARCCDQGYRHLVNSDVFARAIGEVVNTMLSSAERGRSS
ncbi:MAG: hypothetical protein ACR2QW_20710 [bacterium]